jgi:hypothetical protein
MEAYQLLIPREKEPPSDEGDRKRSVLEERAALIREKQGDLRKTMDNSTDELLRHSIQLYPEPLPPAERPLQVHPERGVCKNSRASKIPGTTLPEL